MSDYKGKIKHPKTGKVVDAWFLDDYFGRHRYGVKVIDNLVTGEFPYQDDGKKVYKLEMVKVIE